jgi:uncharacterized protein YecE (DUF72 family)
VLFQFPPFVKRDDDAIGKLLDALPDELRFACEFRDESWVDPQIAERIAAAGGTACYADYEGAVPARLPAGRIAYIRLRSPSYSDEQRQGWLELLHSESSERDVYAFAKHEGVPAGNPYAGVGLAEWLVGQASPGTGS